MSQIQSFGVGATPPIGGPVLTLTGDLGPAVTPTLGNITIEGGGNTTYGFGLLTSIATAENPVIGASTLQVIPLFDTVTTNDAIITAFPNASFSLPINTAVVMSAHVIGNRSDYSAACGGYTIGCARRAAGGAILVGDNFTTLQTEDSPVGQPEFGITVTGNDIEVFVRGTAGLVWNWTCTFQYQVQLL